MGDFVPNWERVDEDSPDRCQYISPVGQCRVKAVEGGCYCPAHGGSQQQRVLKKRELKNYHITKFKERLAELGESDKILSLKDEIAILRLLIEQKLNLCNDQYDLMMMAGPLSDLLLKVEKVVTSCQRLDSRLGNLLDKGRVLQLAQSMVQIVSEEIDDPKILEKISDKLKRLFQ